MGSLQVACIPSTPLLQARLRDALGGPGAVAAFPDTSAALPTILRGEIRCTVVAIDVGSFDFALATLRVLQQSVPTHAVVAWCDRKALSTRQLLDIAQTGVAELVLRDVDDIRHVLGRILNSASQRSHARDIEVRIGSKIPNAMRPLFRFMLEHAHQSMEVHRIASAFGITRQTLRNRLVQHRLPLPRTFMTWCRLLVAGSLLEESGHTLESVAWQLDFNSGHHLGTVLRRYTGTGVAEMRGRGVASFVEASFRTVLRGRDPRSPAFDDDDEDRGDHVLASLPGESAGD